MDGRANAHHLPRGRDDQQRLAEEDERHAHREYGRAAATLGYAQLLEEATASPVLKLPKLLLCGHDPTARAERDTHAVNRHAHVWHVQVTVCVLTPGLLRCVCVLLLTFSLCVEKSFHAHAARVARRGTRQRGTPAGGSRKGGYGPLNPFLFSPQKKACALRSSLPHTLRVRKTKQRKKVFLAWIVSN